LGLVNRLIKLWKEKKRTPRVLYFRGARLRTLRHFAARGRGFKAKHTPKKTNNPK